MTDEQFFAAHPDRQARIRQPTMVLGKTSQRGVQYLDEGEAAFRSLGEHKRNRRRLLLWRVPKDNAFYDPRQPQILKIPFLLFSDETVEDDDETLLPIIHKIMDDARMRVS